MVAGLQRAFRAEPCLAVCVMLLGCGDSIGGGPQGASVSAGTGIPSTSVGGSSTSSVGSSSSGGGGTARQLDWAGLPCDLTAEVPSQQALSWAADCGAGCERLVTTNDGGPLAVSSYRQVGDVVTALVLRDGRYESVAWKVTTGEEMLAFGTPEENCRIQVHHPVGSRGWLGVARLGTASSASYYDFEYSTLDASRLDVPTSWVSQGYAANDRLLVLEDADGPTGPVVGVWSRSSQLFQPLGSPAASFDPRVFDNLILFKGPASGQGLVDIYSWDSETPILPPTPRTQAPQEQLADNPWVIGGSELMWVQGTSGQIGALYRGAITNGLIAGQEVATVGNTADGLGSDKHSVTLDSQHLYVVRLEDGSSETIEFPPGTFAREVGYVGERGEMDAASGSVAVVVARNGVFRYELQ